jgi:mannosyltransferase OCH1-like enzyme
MIPKIIHYCWFGGKKKPKLVRDCISSWEKYLPGYQIIEWNEKNSDLTLPFVKEAYRYKKWAFVADYIRLKVIYNNGGIYLDTDMMVLKSFDELLSNNCFLGAQDSEYLNAAIVGALPKNVFIKCCLDIYDELKFDNNNLLNLSIPMILTKVIHGLGIETNFFKMKIVNNNITIYPNMYFYPFPYVDKLDVLNYKKYVKDESYAVHLWVGSWVELNEFQEFRNGNYLNGLLKVLNKIYEEGISIKYLRKVGYSIKRSFT